MRSIVHRRSIVVVSSFVAFMALRVSSFAPSALPPSPTTRERFSRAATTIRSLKGTSSVASSKPTTTKASVQRTSNELLSLLQRKASSTPSSSSRTDAAAELDVRIDSLVRALVLSRTPFDPYSSIDGPLFASVHFIGETPLWEKIGAPLLGVVARRNVKGQRYALNDGTFVNYAEILGDKLYLTASGNFDDAGPATSATTTATSPPNADSATTDDDGVSRRNDNPFEAMFASLFRSNGNGGGMMERSRTPPALLPTPYDYSATVTGASVVLLMKFAFDVAIEGTGTVRVLYADGDLRVLLSPEDTDVTRGGGDWESRGLIVVQVRVDLVYDDWIDRL